MDLQRVANVIRGLAADGVQKANSGHPGAPLGLADVGQSSILIFSSITRQILSGLTVTALFCLADMARCCCIHFASLRVPGFLDDLKNFRQLGSNTPAILNMATPMVWKQQRGLWDRGSLMQ